mmetsp:Transcript_67885/g.127195  ORF Transcript_67885/g.127195 Transcript_67885/m.127195 type:complete len:270 (-) Transcript_67885:101-910(-)
MLWRVSLVAQPGQGAESAGDAVTSADTQSRQKSAAQDGRSDDEVLHGQRTGSSSVSWHTPQRDDIDGEEEADDIEAGVPCAAFTTASGHGISPPEHACLRGTMEASSLMVCFITSDGEKRTARYSRFAAASSFAYALASCGVNCRVRVVVVLGGSCSSALPVALTVWALVWRTAVLRSAYSRWLSSRPLKDPPLPLPSTGYTPLRNRLESRLESSFRNFAWPNRSSEELLNGVPVTHHRRPASSSAHALALCVLASLMLCASSKTTRHQ